MSLKTLPILFLNLGGEMMYILDQRLKAQNIPNEKAKKVIHDIVSTMLNKKFMEELFKPQDAYSKKAMRTVFDRLAHASIMRLNSASMDKLYDLMTMAFKYQVSLCKRPQDLLLVTLNHMDAMRQYVADNNVILQQVENVYSLLKVYATLTPGQFQLVRQTLLAFFQDMHIRVSIFLKDKVQTSNGKFVFPVQGQLPWGTEVPGVIRYFDGTGRTVRTSSFETNSSTQLADRPGSYEQLGERVTKLGQNMYGVARPVDTAILGAAGPTHAAATSLAISRDSPDPSAKEELDLLSYLITGDKAAKAPGSFRLNLFNNDEEERTAEQEYAMLQRHHAIVIDARKGTGRSELSDLMNDFSVQDPRGTGTKGEDLLELMDSAGN